ncbi:MAG: mannose-1-phosphate guanylyltransferase [Prevotellaceae bacterium]|jgi:mannose-1-phosphate guanylyltransferase|nr:mannose-1-phosphate guanylyltransferase [Prevotellaceae bacterium]
MQNPVYGIIMAGGVGSRFWPLSRNAKPKQFLDILGVGRTFIQQTFDRLTKIIPPENIVVVTSASYKELTAEQLPQVPQSNILLEPLRRNTAPCIAYATYKLLAKMSNATVVVAPSDHLIMNEAEFIRVIKQAIREAEAGENLITIGIKPNRPETGYGYIQMTESAEKSKSEEVRRVKTFIEKPTVDMAKILVKSGEFVWNAGIFIWTLQTIRTALQAHLPDLSKLFEAGSSAYYAADEAPFIANAYNECRAISIDYGVMEKAENVYVICADFGWSDLGTWTSLYLQLEKDASGNALPPGSTLQSGNVALDNAKDCLVYAPAEKLVVLQGLDSYLVVDTNDVLMVCKRGNDNELKLLINNTLIGKGMSMA